MNRMLYSVDTIYSEKSAKCRAFFTVEQSVKP